ncbi:BTB/POZ domain-containing protein [Glycine soja]|uniref:BTB/POZ domain-containing protein n=1 Tax=Glycine soja TaxID=3848 RepID=A0A445HDG5_GLYSO|nr:BTB/POZ domain-containing protein [Glycine soja]
MGFSFGSGSETTVSPNPLVRELSARGTCCRYFGSALLWVLQCKSEALLSMASDVAVKVISFIPNSLLQFHMLDLVYCLSSLLSSHQVEVATPCANALNLVISNLSATSEKAVMEALKETETSMRIVGNRKDFAEGAKKIEYFEETTLLLSTILWRWPPSRFPVGNYVILMKVLANIHTRTDSSIKLTLLKLYTSLSRKRIEDGEVFPQMFVQAMGKSDPHSVRIEGFRLAQCLLQIAVEVNKRKKRSAVRRFLKKDMADLLGSSLDYNAYGRVFFSLLSVSSCVFHNIWKEMY